MTRNDWYIAAGLVALVALTWTTFENRVLGVLSTFIPTVEGFRHTPYWDAKRYSWGYGTQAPGSTGYITRGQAFAEMISHLLSDYRRLRPQVTRSLSVKQWAALLSFSYNAGVGAAQKLLPEINAGDDAGLFAHMRLYRISEGEVNPVLVERREKEIQLWAA